MISTETAEHYVWGEVCDGWYLAQSDGLSVIQERIPPGAGETRHRHHRAEQFFYVLSGTATIEIEGETFALSAQQGASVLPGLRHEIRNDHEEALSFLVISAPPSHGDREECPANEDAALALPGETQQNGGD